MTSKTTNKFSSEVRARAVRMDLCARRDLSVGGRLSASARQGQRVDLGEQSLKNIARPVRAYAMTSEQAGKFKSAARDTALAQPWTASWPLAHDEAGRQ
jgi:hypothetical protein